MVDRGGVDRESGDRIYLGEDVEYFTALIIGAALEISNTLGHGMDSNFVSYSSESIRVHPCQNRKV
jgi:hypothetical protein